jgi:GNAT superfamily N-acetyltransferase
MSLFAEYNRTIKGVETIEHEHGFITYVFLGPDCYIEDIFVHPDHRNGQIAYAMTKQVEALAREKKCEALLGTVQVKFADPTTITKKMIDYGFKIQALNGDVIIMKKELH